MGGIEQVIFQLCDSTDRLSIDNTVLALSRQPAPEPIKIRQHVVHQARMDFQLASTGFSYSVFKKFRELAAEADVINYHFPGRSWTWCIFHLREKPYVVTYHSDIVRQRHLLRLYRP
ncbi:glycosyltransferase [Pseudomonas sp. NA13]